MPAGAARDMTGRDAESRRDESRNVTVVIVAVTAMALLSLVGAWLAPPVSGGARGSSFSTDPDGTEAAYVTLERLGYHVERSIEPVTVIAADPSTTVLVLASPDEPASNHDRRFVREFVTRGGIVLATGCGGASFLSSEAPPTNENPFVERQTFGSTFPSVLTTGVPRISLAPSCPAFASDEPYVTVYGSEQIRAVRMTRIGDGLAVWFAGLTPLANQGIADAGNFDLVLNTIGPPGARTVLWDEYYHGQRRSLWSFAARTPLPWAGAQALVIALAAVLTFSRRRAPIRPRTVEPRTAPMEFVTTMAGLYRQANARGAAVATARGRLRRLLLQATGQPPGIADASLAAAAAPRVRGDAASLDTLLGAAARAANDPRLTAGDALTLVRQMQQTAAALDPGITSRPQGLRYE